MFDDSYIGKIYRFAPPSSLDTARYLTICVADDKLYIQMSSDEEIPHWHLFDGDERQALELIHSIVMQKNP
jgi:hypothetical protein